MSKPKKKLKSQLMLAYFVISLMLVGFGYGVAVGEWHLFPYDLLQQAYATVRTMNSVKEKPYKTSYCNATKHAETGVRVFDRAQTYPGVNLVCGHWQEEGAALGEGFYLGVRLIALDGTILHEWRVDPGAIWDKNPYDDWGRGSRDRIETGTVHGMLLLPNGDLILNLEEFALVRLDKDSRIVWKVPIRTHHSMTLADDGSIWVCGRDYMSETPPEQAGMIPPYVNEYAMRFSQDGELLEKHVMLDFLLKADMDGILLLRTPTGDLLHMNDVEPLSAELAPAFPMFEAGDLLLSFRDINTVMVIDRDDHAVKWALTYPLSAQHDPDFHSDGTITVFDNHTILSAEMPGEPASRILRANPATGEVTVAFDGRPHGFYTIWGGKHETLPNGNLLLTEASHGRAIEVTPAGDIVWDWVAPTWTGGYTGAVMEVTRYPLEAADFTNENTE